MKTLKSSLVIMVVTLSLFACNTQTKENQEASVEISEDVQVYYFHNTKRCATCNAVEDETRVALEMFYDEKMKAGTIYFTSLNLEEEEGKTMAEALQVSGQTLLIVKGETQINLTNEGFMNARTNPTKFHEIIKTQIDNLL
ncbi:MAG: hypothetical protein KAR16_02990 [Bacteroidales bacterium]|nr:hypothetical protein [Bacteroidales bacterium]